ncbi:hypothetical protein N9N08_00630 [bacterium]|nr:hypothetical protein [bacterium]
MFDIFYIGDNKSLEQEFPFAKKVSDYNEIVANTKMYWIIDPNIEISDTEVFGYRPEDYDAQYEHIWKWDNSNYGGVRLLPKKESKGIKEINKVVCKKSFEKLTSTTPENYFDDNPFATHVWCIDPEYKIPEDINWAPSNFEPKFIHSFHLRGQLEHKYPAKEGGIKLYPRDWRESDIKYHNFLDANATYPVFYVRDVEDYKQRNIFDQDYVWLVDAQYKVNATTLDWVPSPFEDGMIHAFKMPYQLQEKYPMAMGGIRLVPKGWREAETKIHPACPVEDESYDVFYVDEDEFTADAYSEYADRSKTDWFWVVDREFQFNGKLLYVPAIHEREFIHVFKLPGHLEERYPPEYTDAWDNRCGGIRLVHKEFDFTKHKYQNDVVPVRYDIFYTDNISDYESHARKSRTKMFWLVDSEHELNDIFKYVPAKYDQKTIQVFKIPNQLEHKYPKSVTNISDKRCGGVKLVPKAYNTESIKYVATNPTSDRSYPVVKVDNVDEYTEVFQDCWIVDNEYKLNQKIEWTPPLFQQNCIHTFHVGDQLKHKYPESMGGLRWVPVDWNGDIVIHSEMLNAIPEYPIYYQDDSSVNPDKDHSCWVADKSYRLDESIKWAPDSFDADKVHVFHIHNQLTNKYPEEMGGLYWYPDNSIEELKIHKDPLVVSAKTFPVRRVNDPSNYIDVTEDCWLVDSDYILEDSDFEFVPWQNENEKDQIHVYQVRGQLEHKYPDEMGGIYWVPANHKDSKFNIHDTTPFGDNLQFETYDNEETGRKKSSTGWFWVVEKDVEVHEDFDFGFIPKVWDNGKKHVWQKLNPVTGRQYDYSGVSLCPKVPQTKGRPKYIRESASTQRKYPVYYLQPEDYNGALQEAYGRLATQSDTDMYWVIDAYTQLDEDFKFDFYPTQWDKNNVHVWQNEDGEHRNVRLIPTNTFIDKEYTNKEIANNSFDKLKLINTIASLKPNWPVVHLQSLEKNEFINAIKDIKEPFVWTIDPDVKVEQSVLDKGFLPLITDINKIHAWQKVNSKTNKVHAYGGLRLWPTDINFSDIKSEDLKFNRFKNLQYVKQKGSTTIPYDIVFLSYKEKNAEENYKKLADKFNTIWVKDIEGIFNAHKEASNKVSTNMFWVVDADAQITEDFDFSYIPDVYDDQVVHVWGSKNPVNNLEYGYGGVKLFPTEMVREADTWGIDFTTGLSNRFKSMPQISCITNFNTDEFSTWRSAFRECVKLTLNNDDESKQRLSIWLNSNEEVNYVESARQGAKAGSIYAKENSNNIEKLNKINDFKWLNEQYNKIK